MRNVDWTREGELYVAIGKRRALSTRLMLHRGELAESLSVAEKSGHPVRKMYFVLKTGGELTAPVLVKLVHHPMRPR